MVFGRIRHNQTRCGGQLVGITLLMVTGGRSPGNLDQVSTNTGRGETTLPTIRGSCLQVNRLGCRVVPAGRLVGIIGNDDRCLGLLLTTRSGRSASGQV